MTARIPARELRNNYAQIIKRVRNGERLTVVTGGAAVMDLVPHASDDAPPMFRPTDGDPDWPALAADAAADWLTDIRALDDAIDQAVTDPWDRR